VHPLRRAECTLRATPSAPAAPRRVSRL